MSGGGLQGRTVVEEVEEDVQAVDDTHDVGVEFGAVRVGDVDAGEQVLRGSVLLEDAAIHTDYTFQPVSQFTSYNL